MLFAGKATFSQACLELRSTLPAGNTRMSRLPLHALQGFVAAARIGNLSRAPESLNLTVSALTHQMRSEEHTSELQSLTSISYATFCLKKTHYQLNYTQLT